MASATGRAAQRGVLSVVILSMLGACATASKDITAAYVSPTQYQSYDCSQLDAETQRLQTRYSELGGRLDQAASNDKALTGAGLILFWPALFLLGGTKQQEAEYARLRGEYDAVRQASVQKHCGMPVAQAVPASSNAAVPLATAASAVN
jgi:hypothetical protein